ncbi:metallophosphoesterase family protein [Methanobacterium paludis]|uniref:Metallophosphoesterase n=1 Tax=Methanobacterium paludis (strain DSM 25820 / JCM 18151 / SWAN1) TaxID=868131 RepID=F6D6F3_METPW|nr:metallophosphoesterase [Methanobacterium paludis]AEG19386.1 metallophosphoesterase [Methanobacterium paludis]
MKRNIIHISDVHFGDPTHSDELVYNLTSQIEEENPDMVIFAGDLTYGGFISEYNNAKNFIEELKSITETHVVPGNHDARNVGLEHFKNLIGDTHFVKIDKKCKLAIIGLDSSRPDIDDGNIGSFQLEWLKAELDKIPKNFGKMVIFHHHLIPIPQSGRERNILLDSGDIIQLLIDEGVNIVLGGHKHVPNVVTLEGIAVINSGTATTRRLRGTGHPCYSQLILNDVDMEANLIFTESGIKKNVANYSFVETDSGVKIHSYNHEAAFRIKPVI